MTLDKLQGIKAKDIQLDLSHTEELVRIGEDTIRHFEDSKYTIRAIRNFYEPVNEHLHRKDLEVTAAELDAVIRIMGNQDRDPVQWRIAGFYTTHLIQRVPGMKERGYHFDGKGLFFPELFRILHGDVGPLWRGTALTRSSWSASTGITSRPTPTSGTSISASAGEIASRTCRAAEPSCSYSTGAPTLN